MKVKIKFLLPVIAEAQKATLFTQSISAEDSTHIIMGIFRLKMFKWHIDNFQGDIIELGNRKIQSIFKLIKTT